MALKELEQKSLEKYVETKRGELLSKEHHSGQERLSFGREEEQKAIDAFKRGTEGDFGHAAVTFEYAAESFVWENNPEGYMDAQLSAGINRIREGLQTAKIGFTEDLQADEDFKNEFDALILDGLGSLREEEDIGSADAVTRIDDKLSLMIRNTRDKLEAIIANKSESEQNENALASFERAHYSVSWGRTLISIVNKESFAKLREYVTSPNPDTVIKRSQLNIALDRHMRQSMRMEFGDLFEDKEENAEYEEMKKEFKEILSSIVYKYATEMQYQLNSLLKEFYGTQPRTKEPTDPSKLLEEITDKFVPTYQQAITQVDKLMSDNPEYAYKAYQEARASLKEDIENGIEYKTLKLDADIETVLRDKKIKIQAIGVSAFDTPGITLINQIADFRKEGLIIFGTDDIEKNAKEFAKFTATLIITNCGSEIQLINERIRTGKFYGEETLDKLK